MNMFDEISKEKVDFPKFKSVVNKLTKNDYNFYQLFAFCLFAIFCFMGVILGNLFSTCETASYYFSDTCIVSQYNFSLMIFICFIGLVISVFFYSIGEVIYLLTSIKEKLVKNKS